MLSSPPPAGGGSFRVFDVIGEALRLFRRHIRPLFILWAVLVLPMFACLLLVGWRMGEFSEELGRPASFPWMVFLVFVMFSVAGVVTNGAAYAGTLSAIAGRGFSLSPSLGVGISRFWPTLGALALMLAVIAGNLLVCLLLMSMGNNLIVLASLAVPLGIALRFYWPAQGAVVSFMVLGVEISLIGLIVVKLLSGLLPPMVLALLAGLTSSAPILLLMLHFYLLWPVLLSEGLGAWQAMNRCVVLGYGHRRGLFGVLIFLIVISVVLSLVVVALSMIGGAAGGLVGELISSFVFFSLFVPTSSICYTRLRQVADDASEQGTPDVSVS